MENKSLNVFNTAYVLADSKTATDQDFQNVEAVIGHEYFHNVSIMLWLLYAKLTKRPFIKCSGLATA